jgi:hypothetical protein
MSLQRTAWALLHAPPFTMIPGEGRSPGASEGKRKRVRCKYNQDLVVTHGVVKSVHGVSICSFCLSFGREQRTTPASAEDGNDRKRRLKSSRNPWSTSDFSRARIDEHYAHSHPKCGASSKKVWSVWTTCPQRLFSSSSTCNMNKLEAHFRRATAGSLKITIRSAVGNLISFLLREGQ